VATVRCMVIDDEPLSRRGVRQLLRRHPDFIVEGEYASGDEALQDVLNLQPAVLFLDVEMPGTDIFDVVSQIYATYRPVIVFLTAHDQYAVNALRIRAVDYVRKPLIDVEFDSAIDRVRQHLRAPAAAARAATRHVVAYRGRTRQIVPLVDIVAFRAARNYVQVLIDGGTLLLRRTMKSLQEQLDPTEFIRIHRQIIVNVHRIGEIECEAGAGCTIVTKCGARLPVGRKYRAQLDQLSL
jgi:two-component system LytT family response regulator